MLKSSHICWLRHALLVSALVVLAGCKSSTDSGGQTDNPNVGMPCENQSGGAGPDYLTVYCVTSFDLTAVNAARNLAEFAIQQFDWFFTDDPSTIFSTFSLRAVRAEFAHSVGLSGAAETIAIVDSGFYINHPELVDKNIIQFGPLRPQDDHGTSVAAIAAGSSDGIGIMGVAYGADLHLTSVTNGLSVLADATDDALQNGAIVQNNSWGYEDTDIANILGRPDGDSAELAFSIEIGTSLATATSYLDALGRFTQSGIIVFANSNNAEATHLGVMEALPLAFPDLEAGWITALNGIPTFNDDGEIVSAVLLSAECFEMAQSCLMAEGVIYGTLGANSYDVPLIGTSFAAPIISGGIAILAEAFPSLAGPEIRDRLLVTADNSFFAAEDLRVFTSDISHGYSSEYGHGFMNLEAALLPIGDIGVPLGLFVSDGIVSIQNSSIATGFAQGDAIATALRDIDVMLLDSLGGNFTTPAETFVQSASISQNSDSFALFVDYQNSQSAMTGALKSLAFALDTESQTHVFGGSVYDVISGIGLLPEHSGLLFDPMTMSEIPRETYSFGIETQIDASNNIAAYAYASAEGTIGDTKGVGVVLGFSQDAHRFSVGASLMQERGATLGMLSGGLDQDFESLSTALDFGYSGIINDRLSIDANAQIGSLSSVSQGMWGGQNNTKFSAYGVALNISNVFTGNDKLVASLRHPIAIDSGSMRVELPQSRDIYGNITTQSFDIDLAPTARQLDFGIEYGVLIDKNKTIRIGAAYILNSANISGKNTTSIALSYTLDF